VIVHTANAHLTQSLKSDFTMLATEGRLVYILATMELLLSSVDCHFYQASTSYCVEIQAQPVPALPLNLNIYHGFEPQVIVVSSSSNITTGEKFKKHASGAIEPDETSDMDGTSATDTHGGASTETKNDYTNRVIKKTATGEEYECPLGEYTPFCSECGGPATEFVFDGHWMSTCLGVRLFHPPMPLYSDSNPSPVLSMYLA
jgi:hypothetical protein